MASSNSGRDSQADRAALPFEPKGGRKKGKSGDEASAARSKSAKSEKATAKREKSAEKKAREGQPERKVSAKAQARVDAIRASNQKRSQAKAARSAKSQPGDAEASGGIPKAVSNRMLRRMAVLSLTPIGVGVGIFFLSYYLLSREIVEFAPVVVLLTTMGCFGLGVVGLTYGMLSASWDEAPGGLVGLDEFKLNLGRMLDAWRESRASKTS
ncbi:MAG: PAM68 family protein [Cyanobacteria bacterium J06554_11]